jgi:hypothetical protein
MQNSDSAIAEVLYTPFEPHAIGRSGRTLQVAITIPITCRFPFPVRVNCGEGDPAHLPIIVLQFGEPSW